MLLEYILLLELNFNIWGKAYFIFCFLVYFVIYDLTVDIFAVIILGGMPGLQNIMKQLQQGAAGGLGNLMGGFGGKS